jgi:hypothetical protein
MVLKNCIKCKIAKNIEAFPLRSRYVDGHTNICKVCTNKYNSEWVRTHRTPEQSRESCRRWKENKPEGFKASMKKYRTNNIKKLQEATRNWRKNNLQTCHKKNPENYSEYGKKRRSTLKGKLNANISIAICNSLVGGKNGWHWEELVGYALDALKEHLEKQFTGDMSWDNYGLTGWTIDHKIPISAFNFETPFDIDFRQCWALRNLQPMWHVDNMSKKDRLSKPHQPSLLMREK